MSRLGEVSKQTRDVGATLLRLTVMKTHAYAFVFPVPCLSTMNDTQAGSQIANTLFPPPPEYYKKFSDANVARYEHLSSTGAGPSRSPTGGEDLTGRAQLTSEDAAELEELSRSLEKPRADWIREEGRWVSFGEMSMVRDSSPTLSGRGRGRGRVAEVSQTTPHIPGPADIGLTPLFDPDQESSLTPLLHSFLHTLLRLIDTLTNSARPPHELAERGWAHEGDQVSALRHSKR